MTKTPTISVILPVYNAERYLYDSINSILNQTYADFELIVINDGSTDASKEIINKIDDSRLVYIENEKNLGLIETLNKGLYLAKGKYIARMDADDISMPNRFEVQVNFLERNNGYIICSANRIAFSEECDKKHISKLPIDDLAIRLHSIFSTPFTHPCTMFLKDVIIKNELHYDSEYKYAEDYEFWINVLKYGKGYNIIQPLLYYRNTPNSQTFLGTSSKLLRKNTISKIQQKALAINGIELKGKELDLQYILSLSEHIRGLDFNEFSVKYIKNYFQILFNKLARLEKYPGSLIYKSLGERYFKILVFNIKKMRILDAIYFIFSPFFIYGFISYLKKKADE
ncbi:conserved hypothetical protein [uncultured Dysgonomonas sp.]|uniref:Glycosyltransferase 2-like domain-containing protein n=1 Tax=uncultured Dysgonomonas sp. TaxID=206096 RepID=A0A212J4J6_9BACT|nr:glycosyltransferase [uncultured Dysgonomonas sp.]SBV94381.1 conserved hypothetical protein [uncultured Dysgonomonas sp.]